MVSSLPAPIKILCVDDKESNLISLGAAFAGSNYELIQVQSGSQALREIQMPVLDGFQTARMIREVERSRFTPIVFLTANFPGEDSALQGYEAGAVDYLFKPLNLQMLRAKVSVFVDLFNKNLEVHRQAGLLREVERREQERELAHVRSVSDQISQSCGRHSRGNSLVSRSANA
jgi:CheY-like chemotaxis protein